jgi:hypothetical protein
MDDSVLNLADNIDSEYFNNMIAECEIFEDGVIEICELYICNLEK